MGAIAEAIAEYTRPLMEHTDGSLEQMQKAMAIGQACWNFAIMPAEIRDKAIDEMQPALQMNDEEFSEFRRDIIDPMIQRHHEMFPAIHGHPSGRAMLSPPAMPTATRQREGPKVGRNSPCPCGSGRKYKQCCGG